MIVKEDNEKFDIVGVGIGPSNLSLAALLEPLRDCTCRFFDSAPEFNWHAGLLFPEATLQVSFIKDLVTLADPSSPYSFLSFLFNEHRLYQFINADFPRVSRTEFNQYLRWVCASLTSLVFGKSVEAIKFEGNSFVIDLDRGAVRSRNIVLGTGLTPLIPDFVRPHLGPTVWHGCDYLRRNVSPAGRRIVVVGGGQTGAEIVFHLLSDCHSLPQRLYWISRRANFAPLDESAFTNELFTPVYSNHFFSLDATRRARSLEGQKLASNGISAELLLRIYRRLYELKFIEERTDLSSLLPCCEMVRLERGTDKWSLTYRHAGNDHLECIHADLVILCTGFEYTLPACLDPVVGRIHWAGDGFALQDDFSINWDGPRDLKIYVQNAAHCKRGIADPNLSLMAWRSAIIANSLTGRCVYDIGENESLVQWTGVSSVSAHERILS